MYAVGVHTVITIFKIYYYDFQFLYVVESIRL